MSPQLGQGVNMALLDALGLRNSLRSCPSVAAALDQMVAQRRRDVGIYHFWSRWLTPLFQSECDGWARVRDLTFHPLSRMPGGRNQMLRVLSGTRQGWFGIAALPERFLQSLGALADAGGSRQVVSGELRIRSRAGVVARSPLYAQLPRVLMRCPTASSACSVGSTADDVPFESGH